MYASPRHVVHTLRAKVNRALYSYHRGVLKTVSENIRDAYDSLNTEQKLPEAADRGASTPERGASELCSLSQFQQLRKLHNFNSSTTQRLSMLVIDKGSSSSNLLQASVPHPCP